MYFDYLNVLVFSGVGLVFVFANMIAGSLIRPKRTTTQGREVYECGEPTIGQAWIRFDIRFYTVALMFVVFDIEIALLFPWGVVFRDMVREGLGWLAFFEALGFIVILMAGLVYVWARKDIEWTGPSSAAPNTQGGESVSDR